MKIGILNVYVVIDLSRPKPTGIKPLSSRVEHCFLIYQVPTKINVHFLQLKLAPNCDQSCHVDALKVKFSVFRTSSIPRF